MCNVSVHVGFGQRAIDASCVGGTGDRSSERRGPGGVHFDKVRSALMVALLEYLIPVLLVWIPNLVTGHAILFIVCTNTTFMATSQSAGQQYSTGYGQTANVLLQTSITSSRLLLTTLALRISFSILKSGKLLFVRFNNALINRRVASLLALPHPQLRINLLSLIQLSCKRNKAKVLGSAGRVLRSPSNSGIDCAAEASIGP